MKRALGTGAAVVAALVAGWLLGSWDGPEAAPPREPKPRAATRGAARGGDDVDAADADPTTTTTRRRSRQVAPKREDEPDATTFLFDDAVRPAGQLRTGRATLFSQATHGDYGRATFSFSIGGRGDAVLERTRGRVEMRYSGNRFDVRLVVGDASTISDLGRNDSLDAVATSAQWPPGPPAEHAQVADGHAYVVHTMQPGSEHTSVLRVTELVPQDRVTFDWADWTPPRPADPDAPDLAAGTQARLARFLDSAADLERAARRTAVGDIVDPADLLLQVRTGAQGGNTSTVSLGDPGRWVRVAVAERELDMAKPASAQDRATAFVRGGFIPAGRALVVESADVFATAAGDLNGPGLAVVRIGGDTLLHIRDFAGPILDWYEGRAILRPGDERLVSVLVANSSVVEVRLRGRFVPLDEAGAIEQAPFWPQPAPPGVPRAADGPSGARSGYLAEPRAVLQVRAGHGGGNTMRVSLLGAASIYLEKMSPSPLQPLPSRQSDSESVGYVEGGRIPRGKAFAVTHIEYEGTTTKRPGQFIVSVMGEKITSVVQREHDESTRGSWTGRLLVPAGSESQVYVETAWHTFGSATLTGEFVDAEAEDR